MTEEVTTFYRVGQILEESSGIEGLASKLTPETSLVNDKDRLDLDSLDIAQGTMDIQDHYDLDIPTSEFDKMSNLRALCTYIEENATPENLREGNETPYNC